MTTKDTPRDFLRNSEFSPLRAEAEFPHARRHLLGGLFVSHAGADTLLIREQIINPVVSKRFSADGYFMHSRGSGGANAYRRLVQAALHWCDKFMIVVSRQAAQNDWVHAELEWALEHQRPILVVRLDQLDWSNMISGKDSANPPRAAGKPPTFDFNSDVKLAQECLSEALDELLIRYPLRVLELFE